MTILSISKSREANRSRLVTIVAVFIVMMSAHTGMAQDKLPIKRILAPPNREILTDKQWKNIEAAVDRGLTFIAANQQPNGSFAGPDSGQPGITSLCVLAFIARGHVPRSGPYSPQLEWAIDYTLSAQRRNGMISIENKNTRPEYSHGISALMLAEVYNMTAADQHQRIEKAIPKAIGFTRKLQTDHKHNKRDLGGWRYLEKWGNNESDLTVSTWQLMFYQSAKNGKFEVPQKYIDEAMDYVHRCFDPEKGGFVYALAPDSENYVSGGSVGGGVVTLALEGQHLNAAGEQCGEWILDNPFDRYNRRRHPDDRYHYSAFFCSQAMFQLGGKMWEEFYPRLQRTLLNNQHPDGSWEAESVHDADAGNVYTTALSVLALTPPYQNLPLFRAPKIKRSEESENPPEPRKKSAPEPKAK